ADSALRRSRAGGVRSGAGEPRRIAGAQAPARGQPAGRGIPATRHAHRHQHRSGLRGGLRQREQARLHLRRRYGEPGLAARVGQQAVRLRDHAGRVLTRRGRRTVPVSAVGGHPGEGADRRGPRV
ncbi:MAG: hypothetical protein AMXMBFR13_33730, partial [Phycisphaerae bacterium]